jgi:hypothetical protein
VGAGWKEVDWGCGFSRAGKKWIMVNYPEVDLSDLLLGLTPMFLIVNLQAWTCPRKMDNSA